MTSKDIFPMLLILIGLVVIMAGAGPRGIRAGGSIFAVIAAFIGLVIVFSVIVARAL